MDDVDIHKILISKSFDPVKKIINTLLVTKMMIKSLCIILPERSLHVTIEDSVCVCVCVYIEEKKCKDILMLTWKFFFKIPMKNRLKLNIIIFLRANLYAYFFE